VRTRRRSTHACCTPQCGGKACGADDTCGGKCDGACASGQVCNGPGKDGWNWTPWNDGRAANAEGEKWKNDAGPDSRFFEAMVRCVGTKFPLDAKRLFVGGISAGGTVTNRVFSVKAATCGGNSFHPFRT
jgi:hypothetical protein